MSRGTRKKSLLTLCCAAGCTNAGVAAAGVASGLQSRGAPLQLGSCATCMPQQADLLCSQRYCSAQLRFQRFGRKKQPFYRLVAIDSRDRRDGRPLEVRCPSLALPK